MHSVQNQSYIIRSSNKAARIYCITFSIISLSITFSLHYEFYFVNPIITSFENHSSSFRVMTYNIRMDTVNDGKNQWHLRKDRVIGLIRHYKPDLLGVQEALPQQMAIMVLMVLVVMMEETVASFLLYFIVTIVLNSQIKVHSGYQKLQTHLVV